MNQYPHQEWRIGDWRVNPELGEISRNGLTKRLDPRAMRLLIFLAERPGKTVGISEVLDGVWAKSVVTAHSAYEAVAALRQALEDSSNTPEYIVTLPRRGYRLIATVVPPQPASEDPSSQSATAHTAPVESSKGARLVPSAWIWFGLAVATVAILKLAWVSHSMSQPEMAAPTGTSIAVLPLVDLSESKDQEYLADGLAEELLDVLANLPQLRVIGRTSSFQFKNKNMDVRSIGSQLGAAYVVEGSVRRVDNRVRVAVQLIRASDGSHQWSGTIDRHIDDILQVESELAASLGRALQLSVTSNRVDTANSEAHDHYLKGLHALDAHSQAGAVEAANQFQAAIAIDQHFAAARISLAMTYYVQAAFGFAPPEVAFPKMQKEALAALKLNSQSAIAHALLARMATLYSWDWVEAKRESELALSLAPQNSFALFAAGDVEAVIGDLEKAEQLFRASLVSDPLNPESHFMLATVMPSRLDAAEAEARRCLTIAPSYAFGHDLLAFTLLMEGRGGEAVEECKLEANASAICLARVYFALGRAKESDAALEQALRSQPATSSYSIAGVYAYRSQNDLSFEWLDRAYRERNSGLVYLAGDPNFDKIRGDLRYKALLHAMNLTEASAP